ncbi:flocculation protein FLO11-like isoform X2 [Thalassophryne amazonica]|uniref:flocculation protein FLO11-like isoform X2 n=1 Tax=Thalassophryne amazonica TaxID=390379 RepID=UPI0014712407|nr:flocculation protein FLO11-like isoform X2 [Thalassophryne amazonica]
MYICNDNKNTSVKFFSALFDQGTVTFVPPLSVTSVTGSVTGTRIQCVFEAPLFIPMGRTLNNLLSMGTGILKNGTAEPPEVTYQGVGVDFSATNSTVPMNSISNADNTTTAVSTTSLATTTQAATSPETTSLATTTLGTTPAETTSLATTTLATTPAEITSLATTTLATTPAETTSLGTTTLATTPAETTSLATTTLATTTSETTSLATMTLATTTSETTSLATMTLATTTSETTSLATTTQAAATNATTPTVLITQVTTAVATPATVLFIIAGPLSTPIDRTGCGITDLCISEAPNCDPSQSPCIFLAVRSVGGDRFRFKFSGFSSGYIAIIISADSTPGGNDTMYICNDNKDTSVKFFSALFDQGTVTFVPPQSVTSVTGSVTGTRIQCVFEAPLFIPMGRTLNNLLSMGTGILSENGTAEPPEVTYQGVGVDFSAPNSTVPMNSISNADNTTTAVSTTSLATTTQAATSPETTSLATTTLATTPAETTSLATTTIATTPAETTSLATTTQAAATNATTPTVLITQVTTAVATPATVLFIIAGPLSTPIDRTGCGITDLCISEAPNCDPSQSPCIFLAVRSVGGDRFRFKFSGFSSGYIAIIISADSTPGGNDTMYICNDNKDTSVKFFSALFDQGTVTFVPPQSVTSVTGSITGTRIQCVFEAPLFIPMGRTLSNLLSMGTGILSENGTAEPPEVTYQGVGVDLALQTLLFP